MLVNSKMTHFTKTFNKATRLDEWTATVYNDVLWQGGRGARFNKGLDESNDVKVRIPYSLNEIGTFKLGDIIVKGEITEEITSQNDLTDSYNITSIVDNNFGNLKHIHLEGK